MNRIRTAARMKWWRSVGLVAALAAIVAAGTAQVSASELLPSAHRGGKGADCARTLLAGSKTISALDELVGDGTITAEQRAAIVARMGERATRAERACAGLALVRSAGVGEAVQTLLGMDRREIAQAWRDGQSLTEMAQSKGVDRAALVDTIVNALSARLDQAVEQGRITAERKTELMTELTTRVESGVDLHKDDLRGEHGTGSATPAS